VGPPHLEYEAETGGQSFPAWMKRQVCGSMVLWFGKDRRVSALADPWLRENRKQVYERLRKGDDKMRKVMAMMICLAMVGMTGIAFAQQKAPVAGTTTVGIAVPADELVIVAKGWSATKQIIGKDVFNDKQEKVGVVEDLIIAPDKAVSYAIIGAGGFLGMAKHNVAIRVNNLKLLDGKITLPGATKDAVKALPAFEYAK
jgi:sporulation protein YlmC with PRC-barrel domain